MRPRFASSPFRLPNKTFKDQELRLNFVAFPSVSFFSRGQTKHISVSTSDSSATWINFS